MTLETREELKAEVNRLRKRLGCTRTTIESLRNQVDALKSKIRETNLENWERIQERIRQEMNHHPGWREDQEKEPWERPIVM